MTALNSYSKTKEFVKWLDTEIYNPFTFSLEMLWLMFYMEQRYNKRWDAVVKEWI
jgi:hypothetical protein